MGDYQDDFGSHLDAVDVIDRISCQETMDTNQSGENWEDGASDFELAAMLRRNSPFEGLPGVSAIISCSGEPSLSFDAFIEAFSDAYDHGNRGDHVGVLLEYAACRNPEAIRSLRRRWCEFQSAKKIDLSELTIASCEEKIAPIARAGIGALMMVGISGEEIKAIYGALRHGRYT